MSIFVPYAPFMLDFFTYYGNIMTVRDLDVEHMTLVQAKDEVMKLRAKLRDYETHLGEITTVGDATRLDAELGKARLRIQELEQELAQAAEAAREAQ